MNDLSLLNPRILVQMGATINLGDYQSAKAVVGMEIDKPKELTADEAYDMLHGMLLEKLDETLDVVIKSIRKR